MIRSFLVLIFCCLSTLLTQTHAQDIVVQPKDYQQFWIWGDISTNYDMRKAQELYILQGQVSLNRSSNQSVLIRQGIAPRTLKKQGIWVVIRSHHLAWSEHDYAQVTKVLAQWKQRGNHVIGLQIDFDSPTNSMYNYARFLETLRGKLPLDYKLSITGLMDWVNITEVRTLNLLKENIDEIVFQSYYGTRTHVSYQKYLAQVPQLGIPFKVGIVENGRFNPQLPYRHSPLFKGHIVFLLRSKSRI